jgi:hypothetical protein
MNKISKIMVVIFLILFAIAIFIENYRASKQYEILTPILRCDSLDIIVDHYIDIHGTIIFNKKYSANGYEFENPSKEIIRLLDIDYPFKLKKEAENDTIFVIKGVDTLLNLTFRKDTQDSFSVYDSSFRELFEIWREKRKKTLNNGSPN